MSTHSPRDFYEILEVNRSADDATLKKAYRAMAMRYHPDRNPGDAEAEARFKEASEAYEVLSNPEKRRLYDQFGHQGLQGMGGGRGGFSGTDDIFETFGDIFEDFFGFGGGNTSGRRARPRKGGDYRYDLTLSFEEAAFGLEKEIEVTKPDACNVCSGTGAKAGSKPQNCSMCGGAGQVRHSQGFFTISSSCPQCRGQGQILADPCAECHGQGHVTRQRKLKVKIPAGVDHGMRLVLQGEGEPGSKGGSPGDLYVFIHVKEHKDWKREGAHLWRELDVTPWQLVLGDSVSVDVLGENIEVDIVEGSQPDSDIVVRGKGLPTLKGQSRGDVHLRLKISIPKKLSAEHKELYQKMRDLEKGSSVVQVKKNKKKSKGFFSIF
jgi:molecular chaperone DnaJ